ncbi:MAG: hypothetical protein AB8G15_20670 [Saprospiraceae bacterium]
MIALSEPIGRFVALANLEKNVFPQKSIEKNIADIVDLITIRIKDKSLDEVSESLLENIFDFRFDLIEWLIDNDKDFNSYVESTDKYIAVNLQLAPFSNLAETISKTLLAYQKIISPISDSMSNSFEDIYEDIQNNTPDYDFFKLLSHHPSPQIKYLKKWIDASLKLDIGLILADLILTNQVQLPKKRIKSELIDFLDSSITKFGAYSIFTGFWIPKIEDASNLTNRMKILSATTELSNKSFYKTSKEGFSRMVNN